MEANRFKVDNTAGLPWPEELEMRIAVLEEAAVGVFFNACCTTPFSQTGSVINYNCVRLNVGNGLDPDTGTFKVTVGGLYAFHFNGYYKDEPFTLRRTTDHAEVNLILNGIKLIGKTTSGPKYGSFSLSVVLALISGDTIYAVLRYGHIVDNRNMHTQFTGYLLN